MYSLPCFFQPLYKQLFIGYIFNKIIILFLMDLIGGSKMTINKKNVLMGALISVPLITGHVYGETAETVNQSTQKPNEQISFIDKAIKAALDVLVKPTTWAWNKAQDLTGGGAKNGIERETKILQFNINAYREMLAEREAQLKPYAPNGNLKTLEKLVLKEAALMAREKKLGEAVEKSKNKINELSILLSLFEVAPTSLKTKLARGGGAVSGAVIGYLVSRHVIDKLLNAGHNDLANTLSKVQALRQQIKDLSASIKKSTELEKKRSTEQKAALAGQVNDTQQAEFKKELETLHAQLELDRKKLASLRKECSTLESELLAPQNRSTLASVASTVIPFVCGIFGGIIGYKIVEYLTRSTPRALTLEDQKQADQLRHDLQVAKNLYDEHEKKHNSVAQQLNVLNQLPANVKGTLAQYLQIKDLVKELKEKLENSTGAPFAIFIEQLKMMLNP